ncbi:exopolysaccharide biosynthesis polyprenyl glycosylphosphotransferase [Rhodoligotrophos ferricapiens]|uniref:exopolysaccharide biosynthesis polyprenyl glycosylphosphotransferase n=1 Tax=Rhodoligotrophos ferricapiens TaxID=3069264 RepID=UPI00315CAF19
MTRWTHGLINRLVLVCDVTMLGLSAALAHLLWNIGSWGQIFLLFALGAVVFTQLLHVGNGYRVEHYVSAWRQMRHLLVAGIPAFLAVTAAYWLFIPEDIQHMPDMIRWGLLTYVLLLFGRLVLVRTGITLANRRALLRRNVVLIGPPNRVRSFLARRDQTDTDLFRILGVFSDSHPASDYASNDGVPYLGPIDELFTFVHGTHVDVVVILEPWQQPAEIGRIADRLYRIAADVVVPLDPEEFNLRFATIVSVAGVASLQVQRQPLKGSMGLIKLAEDYVVATIGLILTAPVLIIAALAIKLDSPGPILFRQERLGFNNKLFKVYKLRTMRFDPQDDGAAGTRRNDPRVTRVGDILRRTSIDEIPQLINVLQGDMSVVGPRPHVPNMQIGNQRQFDVVREYAARYRMKPGITGWAQINGMRGGIHTIEKAARGVKLDLYYIENWSLWFDIKIMLLTITKGMVGRDVF